MKTSIKTSAIFATALFAGVLAVGNAFTANTHATASVSSDAIPSVVITALRMSEDQKIAFDAEQSGMQTVVISAKHLTADQKLAMDKADTLNAQHIAASGNHRTAI